MNIENLLKYLLELGTSVGLKLVFSLIILIVGLKVIKFIKKWFLNSKKLNKMDGGVRSFFASFVGIALYVLLFITIAMMLGIPTTSFVTALASCGVAIGLAMQGSLSNVAGGIMILIFKPFKVGDFVEVSDESGTVSEITVIYTVITTVDNKVITIPNGVLTNSVIINYSKNNTRRLDLKFDASYNCDIDKVKDIITSVVLRHECVIKEPEPVIRLADHNASSLTYIVWVWCKVEDYWNLKFDLVEEVKKEFDKNNIEIPFPQLDVHLDK